MVGARAGLFPEALRVVAAQRTSVARFASRSFPLDEVAPRSRTRSRTPGTW